MPKRITSLAERPSEKAPRQRRRQEGEPDLERAVAEHELQVERREEEPREHRRPAIRTPTTFAVETLRRRKSPSGMSGDCDRAPR